jgi:hypothetical protein
MTRLALDAEALALMADTPWPDDLPCAQRSAPPRFSWLTFLAARAACTP